MAYPKMDIKHIIICAHANDEEGFVGMYRRSTFETRHQLLKMYGISHRDGLKDEAHEAYKIIRRWESDPKTAYVSRQGQWLVPV